MALLPFPPSTLDGNQVLQAAFDESAGALRVEGVLPTGAIEVAIDASTDNIAIKDPVTGNVLHINSDGSINVDGGGSGGGNASVGATGATAPTSATEMGAVDPSGDLVGLQVNTAGELKVTGSTTITGPVTTAETGLNAFKTSQYTVGLTAIQLTIIPLANRSSASIAIIADATAIVYIGNSSTVTISSGYPLYDKNSLELDLTPSGTLWAISDTAGQTVAVLEIA